MTFTRLPPELLDRIAVFFDDLSSHVHYYHLCTATRSLYSDSFFKKLLSLFGFSRPKLLAARSYTNLACTGGLALSH